MSKRILWIVLFCLLMQDAWTQTLKTITVSQQAPFTDHLTLAQDSRDKDLMVKFLFNEEANTLTVSLISYRSLFVFWDQVHYRPAVWNGKVRQHLLPYVVEDNPNTKFKLSRDFKRSIPKPRKDYVFNRWIVVEGLQPIPTPYRMVNAIVEQKFDIVGKRDMVKVTLRDILLMDKKQTHVGRPDCYEISFGTDLNIQYQVLISRDPCFGMDEEKVAAEKALTSVEKAADAIQNRFGKGEVANAELLNVFEEMKSLFLQQFQHHEGTSSCPDVNHIWNSYNQFVNQVASLQCIVSLNDAGNAVVGDGVNSRQVLAKARQIDNLVSRWLLTNDNVERRDIISKCNDIIGEVDDMVALHGVVNEEQRNALNVFHEAQDYFKTSCLKP